MGTSETHFLLKFVETMGLTFHAGRLTGEDVEFTLTGPDRGVLFLENGKPPPLHPFTTENIKQRGLLSGKK